MQSYSVASYLLRQNGLNRGEYEEVFAKNPPAAIHGSYYGDFEASGAGDKVLYMRYVKKHIGIHQSNEVPGSKRTTRPFALGGKK